MWVQDELECLKQDNKNLREALRVIAEEGMMMGGYEASSVATDALMQSPDIRETNDGGSDE